MNRPYRGLGLLVVGTLVAGTVACDDDPTGPGEDESTFSLQITGALQETASGPAWFGSDTEPGGEAMWALVLGDGDARHLVIAGRPGAQRPGVGSYALVDGTQAEEGWTLAHFVGEGEELDGIFVAESGTVTITVSTATEVRGTVAYRAIELLEAAPDTVNVTGTFFAAPAPSPASSVSAIAGAGDVGALR